MRVLLTGGTGYVGSGLREHLRNAGHQVRLLVRAGSENEVPATGEYEITPGDIFNTNACLRASEGCDAVVHLVGIIREFPSMGIIFDQFHRQATHNIVDAARRNGVGRFIHMSALGTKEDAKSLYHRSKYVAEQEVRNSPLRWTIFRPSWIFAPGDELVTRFSHLVAMPFVPLIQGGKSLFQPVALDDVCITMTRALEMPETQGETFELGGPDRISFHDVAEKIAAQLGKKPALVNVPAWAVRPVAKMLQRFPSFPLTVDQLRMLSEDNVCAIDPWVKAFQLEPKSFLQALPDLVKTNAVGVGVATTA